MPEGLPEGDRRVLVSQLNGIAARIAASPVQIEDANTCRRAASLVSDLPAIIDQAKREERERVKAALLGDVAIDAAGRVRIETTYPHRTVDLDMRREIIRAAADAALDHTEPQDEEER